MEGDDRLADGAPEEAAISIHSLRMEGDLRDRPIRQTDVISIHSLRMEGDVHAGEQVNCAVDFNPLPPHGGRLPVVCVVSLGTIISIHSLRMEGDGKGLPYFWR